MDQDLVKKRHRELSKRQAIFVAARERGIDREKSAIMAGAPPNQGAGKQMEKSLVVQEELAKARAELAAVTGVTKEDILAGLVAAANIAREMADPAAMVRAWAEIGKLMGHYAPEVKRHEHGMNPEDRELLKRLPDNELHKLARGRVIEGEAKRVEEGS